MERLKPFSRLIADLVAGINEQKEKLLFERTQQKVEFLPTDWTLEAECKRKFPRIKREFQADGTEDFYWNDGSEKGIHLITFLPMNPEYKWENDSFKAITEIKYK